MEKCSRKQEEKNFKKIGKYEEYKKGKFFGTYTWHEKYLNLYKKDYSIYSNSSEFIKKEYIEYLIRKFSWFKASFETIFGLNKLEINRNYPYFEMQSQEQFEIPKFYIANYYNADKLKCKYLKGYRQLADLVNDILNSEITKQCGFPYMENEKNNKKQNEIMTNLEKYVEKFWDKTNKNTIISARLYYPKTINELFNIYIATFIDNQNIQIKQCVNCGKWFKPISRDDEIYCRNISPQNSKRTCHEFGVKLLSRERIKADKIRNAHDKIKLKYRKRIERAKNDKEKLELNNKLFNNYLSEYEKKLNLYKANKLKESDFIKWLEEQ